MGQVLFCHAREQIGRSEEEPTEGGFDLSVLKDRGYVVPDQVPEVSGDPLSVASQVFD